MFKENNEIPFFSVIICTYNRANLIARALDSLVSQDFKNFEVIIIDDGSNDDTNSVIKTYLDKLIIKYKYQKNQGLSYARNEGINLSIGKFITFLDSDDKYHCNHLMSRFNILSKGDIDFIHGGVEIIGNQYVPDLNDVSKLIHIKDCIIGGTFFFKKLQAQEVGLFSNIKYADDNDFYNKITSITDKIVNVEQPTYIYYRDTVDSICSNINN
jgi:glycosyltransferase involved in cell wall biosynthesis